MAKIIITKKDIETDNVELPEEYNFSIKATRAMLLNSINKAINDVNSMQGVRPSNEELIKSAKTEKAHPYYEAQIRLDYLNNLLNDYE